MRSEPFWQLIAKQGIEIEITRSRSIRSFKSLNETVAYAENDRKLFTLLQHPHNREILEKQLLNQYFNNSKSNYLEGQDSTEETKLKNQTENSSGKEYRERLQQIETHLDDSQY